MNKHSNHMLFTSCGKVDLGKDINCHPKGSSAGVWMIVLATVAFVVWVMPIILK